MGTKETRQQAEEKNPNTQEVAENEQQPEDSVSVFDEITSEQDSKDSDSEGGEDQELEAAESSESETGEGQSDDNQGESQGSPNDGQLTGDDSVDALRQEKAKLEHADKANRGRVSALTKKLNETREQLKKLQSTGDLDEAPTPDEIQALEEDFPEAAKLAKAYVSQIRSELNPIRDYVDGSIQSQQEQIQHNELDRVGQRHPDFQEVAGSDHFQNWAQASSPGIQALYQSDTADDAIALLDLYKQQFGNQQPSQQPGQRPSNSRRADLEAHAELPRKGASRASAQSDDPVEIFDQIT